MREVNRLVFIITVTICLVVLLASVSPLITGRPLNDNKSKMLVGIVASLVAIVSMYIGRRGGGGK